MNNEIKEILDFLDDDNRERPFGISNHDLKFLRDYITNLQKENERLNNIINNFEKWLEEYISLFKEPDIYEEQTLEDLKVVLDKLQELKGDSSNE